MRNPYFEIFKGINSGNPEKLTQQALFVNMSIFIEIFIKFIYLGTLT
jgi:hypothetical protein